MKRAVKRMPFMNHSHSHLLCVFSLCVFTYGLPSMAYDETTWGDDTAAYTIVPNLENTPATMADPYFGPPGYRKNRPPSAEAITPPKAPTLLDKVFRGGKDKRTETTAKEAPQITPEMITQVGPREFPASPEPLLRLTRTLTLANGQRLKPDVYLVQPLGLLVDAVGRIHQQPYALRLVNRGYIVLELPLQLYQNVGQESPLTQMNNPDALTSPEERRAPYRAVTLLESPRGEAGQLLYQVGDLQYITPAFPLN